MKQAHIFRYVLRLHSKHCFSLQSITFTTLFVFSLGHRRLEERQINFAGFCFSYKYYITFFYCKDAVVQEWYRSCFSQTLRFFFKFVSRANNSKIYQKNRKQKTKKCSPWKVFGINHPQTLQLLSRRGPRSLDVRLSQRYICHYWDSGIIQISAEKSFQAWQ